MVYYYYYRIAEAEVLYLVYCIHLNNHTLTNELEQTPWFDTSHFSFIGFNESFDTHIQRIGDSFEVAWLQNILEVLKVHFRSCFCQPA